MIRKFQISKSGTVLESWECEDFKTVPDFEIWARFDWEIEEKRKCPFFMDMVYVLNKPISGCWDVESDYSYICVKCFIFQLQDVGLGDELQ